MLEIVQNVFEKNVIVKQIEKKSLKNTKENLLNRKISKKYFWIFHLTRLRELEIEFSSLLFVSFEVFFVCCVDFPRLQFKTFVSGVCCHHRILSNRVHDKFHSQQIARFSLSPFRHGFIGVS